VSFFSDERTNELKELFFESAQELLQSLNEQGLDLEKRPGDSEVIRGIRRTVHTLKGDSAACGYKELSELAHRLEDVLTPELASRDSGETAQVVLTAADIFDSMLSAYRGNSAPPSGDALRELVDGLKQKPAKQSEETFKPSFSWTEYERLMIEQAIDGKPAYTIGLKIDPQCPMRFAALQLINNVLKEAGTLIVIHPEENTPAEDVDTVEAVLASSQDVDWLMRKCRVPAVVSQVVVRPYVGAVADAPIEDVTQPLGDVLAHLTPQAVMDAPLAIPQAVHAEDTSQAPSAASPASATENILRVDAERIDNVLNLVGELIIGKSMLHQAVVEFTKRFPKDPLRARFADMMAYQSQALNELQRSVMKIRMVPVEQVFRRLPRVVRDVAKIRNKIVNLEISGQETDLDKSILDLLAEPLTHLVRNAVDHGIELPAERVTLGKPPEGKLRLNAYHQGNQVIIEVGDDGRGIDAQKVIAKAIATGVVTAEEASRMTDGEISELIFEPGLSTADEISEISGRGVGLDVVKTVLQRMKGSVSVYSRPGEGTTFQLKVPLTLAIIRALLFHAGSQLYAVPLNSVVEIARASEQEIHRVDGREVLQLRDQVLTLVRPGRLLGGVARVHGKKRKLFVVIVSFADRKFGLIVDELIGEEELVIKALDDHLVSTDLVSGASILGNGAVVLILNVTAVVERLGRMRDVERSGELAVKELGAHA
jgi:two-component system chemotaxis sensor kinase CheA